MIISIPSSAFVCSSRHVVRRQHFVSSFYFFWFPPSCSSHLHTSSVSPLLSFLFPTYTCINIFLASLQWLTLNCAFVHVLSSSNFCHRWLSIICSSFFFSKKNFTKVTLKMEVAINFGVSILALFSSSRDHLKNCSLLFLILFHFGFHVSDIMYFSVVSTHRHMYETHAQTILFTHTQHTHMHIHKQTHMFKDMQTRAYAQGQGYLASTLHRQGYICTYFLQLQFGTSYFSSWRSHSCAFVYSSIRQ